MGALPLPGPAAPNEESLLNPKGGTADKAPAFWRRLRSSRELMTVVACAMFMTCSATMLIVNKEVVVHFETPVLVLLAQNLMAVAICTTVLFHTLHYGSRADVLTFIRVVPLFYAGMLCSSSIAQRYASLGLQVVIRNLAPLVTLPIERIFNEPILVDVWTWASMVFILGGITLYVVESLGWAPYHVEHSREQKPNDLLAGIFLMILNMALAIVERLYQRRLLAITPVDISKTGMMLLNNAVACIPVTIMIFPMEEYKWEKLHRWGTDGPGSSNASHYALLALSGVCGVAIAWTSINAQQYVTATTMLLLTNLNKVVVIIYGMIFRNEPNGPFAVSGCVIALSGGVWYAFVRRNLGKKQAQAKEAAKGSSSAGGEGGKSSSS